VFIVVHMDKSVIWNNNDVFHKFQYLGLQKFLRFQFDLVRLSSFSISNRIFYLDLTKLVQHEIVPSKEILLSDSSDDDVKTTICPGENSFFLQKINRNKTIV